jgi:DNA ligase (NAD+)
MEKIDIIKQLIIRCNEASSAYYTYDKPIMTDKEYDNIYDELLRLEKETGVIMSHSPTQKVQGEVLDNLVKVKHTEPMLSADKSKDIKDIIKFMNKQECALSWKLDGLTLVLKYNNGELYQALTRGGGDFGEDVTHSAKVFYNLPLKINYKGYLELRGEALITFAEFNRINEELIASNEEPYSSPRNLAAGTARQLDSNVTKSRNPIFITFGIINSDNNSFVNKDEQFIFLKELGFQVVEGMIVNETNIEHSIAWFQTKIEHLEYLTDGLIIEYRNLAYGKAQGSTGHHSKSLFAFKWNDDTYETKFKSVELNTTRTGMASITAIFDEVNIDGVKVERASLHNYDIFEELQLGENDIIQVYRANQVIPQVHDNDTRSGTYEIEMKCTSCGGDLEIKRPKETRFLFCNNSTCPAQLIGKLSHFVSRDAMNIDGLSEATLEKLIDKGFIETFSDIYNLEHYKDSIVNMDGFGKKSYDKLIAAIEQSKNTEMQRLIYGLGIPNIGKSSSKIISKYFENDIHKFIKEVVDFDFTKLEDFGSISNDSIHKWANEENLNELLNIVKYLNFKNDTSKIVKENCFSNKTFVVTGSLQNYTRNSIQEKLESLGVKVSGSISKKTDYLLVGADAGSKLNKAKELGVIILTEIEFEDILK